jgi:hypothetical protein
VVDRFAHVHARPPVQDATACSSVWHSMDHHMALAPSLATALRDLAAQLEF